MWQAGTGQQTNSHRHFSALNMHISSMFLCMKRMLIHGTVVKSMLAHLASGNEVRETWTLLHYVGTVNGPTSITQLGVWKMYQKIARFSFLDPPPQQTLTIFWGGIRKFFVDPTPP